MRDGIREETMSEDIAPTGDVKDDVVPADKGKEAAGDTIDTARANADLTQSRFEERVDAKKVDDDVPDEIRGLMVIPCKDMEAYYPTDQKPYKNFESLRDACYKDFQEGEGMVNVPYLDCEGHLTVGVGFLLYHKNSGENNLNVDNQSRFDVLNFTPLQKELSIKATELLNKKDFMGKEPGVFVIDKKDKETGDVYHIQMEKMDRAGAKILSVQKNDEAKINMPFISRQDNYSMFCKVFKQSYDNSLSQVSALYNMNRETQLSLAHQVWARGCLPEGARNIRTPGQAYNVCADSIAYRRANWGVSTGETHQIIRAENAFNQTLQNALHNQPQKGSSSRPNITFDADKDKEAYINYVQATTGRTYDFETNSFVLSTVYVKGKNKKKSKNSDENAEKRNLWQRIFHKKNSRNA